MNMSLKEKNKLKKVEMIEKQKEAAELSQRTDALLDDLFDQNLSDFHTTFFSGGHSAGEIGCNCDTSTTAGTRVFAHQ